ncbi:NAD(P)H-hydrate epimerase [Paracoccus thiocyanatus]|uniref:NAD(P)H-hydrate epimerase n=1 Tax=Paracoccus thiocyanatus TaxID=34006 RepID=A0A3D8P7K3_9RHOB|nr:NAD(P)H-hydrate epimerase [Paracoccus thiocyanatus]
MLHGAEILTTEEMRAIESAAMASGQVTGLELMERAGRAVAGQIRLRWPKPGRATVLCGPGNNGGDGYVVARYLHQAGWRVRLLGLDNTPGPDAARMKAEWLALGPILPLTRDALRAGPDADVYVDAIFGTGLTRPPQGEIAAILAYLGGSGGDWACFRERLVAVDCPSGLCLDSGAFPGRPRKPGSHDPRARLTVAFDSPKPGHLLERGPECCGELVIADIGLAAWRVRNRNADGTLSRGIRYPAVEAIWPDFAIPDSRRNPARARSEASSLRKEQAGGGHKFSHGHALIVAGGRPAAGGGRLSARAALRIGRGAGDACAAIRRPAGPCRPARCADASRRGRCRRAAGHAGRPAGQRALHRSRLRGRARGGAAARDPGRRARHGSGCRCADRLVPRSRPDGAVAQGLRADAPCGRVRARLSRSGRAP